MNHRHVIVVVSVFLTALVENNSYPYPSTCHHAALKLLKHYERTRAAVSVSFVDLNNNHPRFPSRLTFHASTTASGQLVEEVQDVTESKSPKQQHQPEPVVEEPLLSEIRSSRGGGPWMDRVHQLLAYQQEQGHCLVPKRYDKNPALGNWVNKQRQEYKRYQSGKKPCALTPKRIEILDRLGFCWDASQTTVSTAASSSSSSSSSSTLDEQQDKKDENDWQRKFQEVKTYMASHNLTTVMDLPRQSTLDVWMQRQREVYGKLQVELLKQDEEEQQQQGDRIRQVADNDTPLIISNNARRRMQKLSALDCDWHLTRRQAFWECRFRELIAYKKQHGGDCCVPISYQANPQLAHWVSNQRKLYNRRRANNNKRRQEEQDEERQARVTSSVQQQQQQQQQHYGGPASSSSGITEERFQRLDAAGFVWNRWDYEFAKKKKRNHHQAAGGNATFMAGTKSSRSDSQNRIFIMHGYNQSRATAHEDHLKW